MGDIQRPAAGNIYRKSYKLLVNAAAFLLQPAFVNFDIIVVIINKDLNKSLQEGYKFYIKI